MNRTTALALVFPVLFSGAVFAAGDCCAVAPAPLSGTTPATPAPAAPEAPASHALRGAIVALVPDKSSLLVKHEEIPGVMRAMTMLLKVDPATLAAAKKDQAITATLIRKADGWWLEDVRPAAAEAKPDR